tara:strand:+ start:633 stop:803 length:171 start_codon:yes stop_codon:yes gene_type:complete
MLKHAPGFSWIELYSMPISMRQFYAKLILKDIKQEAAANKKLQKQTPKIPTVPKLK